MLNAELIKKMDQVILDETLEKYAEKFVESSSPLVKTLDRVLQMLIESNKDFVEDENFDLNWTCTMIDDRDKFDLFVMDDMKFITLTKAVAQVCQNEHQLAYLMANALAHFLLKHKREPVSKRPACLLQVLSTSSFISSYQTSSLTIYGLVIS